MRKLLIVDDDKDLADLIKLFFEDNGFVVSVAYDSRSALSRLQEEGADLVLMDIMLPGMNGGQIAKTIRDLPGLSDVPIIFLTGLVSDREEENGLVVDGTRFEVVAKPFDIQNLLQMIRSKIGEE